MVALLWIGVTTALFGAGRFVVHSQVVTDFDRHVTNWVVGHRTPDLDAAMRAVTWIGSWVAVAVAALVVLGLMVVKRLTIAHLLIFAVAWAGEYSMVTLTKYAIDRPRPPERLWLVTAHGASFPSGHAASATLVCVTAALVASFFARRRVVGPVALTLAGLVTAAVAFSRVELGVHWTSDVLAGSLVIVVWLVALGRVVADAVPLPSAGRHRTGPGISRSAVDPSARPALALTCP